MFKGHLLTKGVKDRFCENCQKVIPELKLSSKYTHNVQGSPFETFNKCVTIKGHFWKKYHVLLINF